TRRSPRSTGCVSSAASGPIGRRPRCRGSPIGCWCSVAGRWEWSSARRCRDSAPRSRSSREPTAYSRTDLGAALAEVVEDEGIDLRLGVKATEAERHGEGFALSFEDGSELRGDKLLVATGRRPRVHGVGLEAVGIDPEDASKGIPVDDRMKASDSVWAIGDVTGIWPFTHVGKYQGRVAAWNIMGRDVTADYRAVPRVVFTAPQVAAVGEVEGQGSGTAQLSRITRAETYSREYDKRPGFLTLISD